MFCKCLLQTDKSKFNYSSQPTQSSLCLLENTQVFCFSKKKFFYFPGWQGGIFSFEILIVNFYSLLQNANAALKHEKRWQKLVNMINPLEFIYHLSFAPSCLQSWACWTPHLWFWALWNQNLYSAHVPTWLNKNNNHLSRVLPLREWVLTLPPLPVSPAKPFGVGIP